MSLNFLNARKDVESRLADQIHSLQEELKSLRRQAGRRGAQSYSDARDSAADLVEDIRDTLAPTMAQMRRQARHAGENVRSHPAASVAVGLIVLGLAAALFAGRSSSR